MQTRRYRMPYSIIRYLLFHRDVLAIVVAVPLSLFFSFFIWTAGYAALFAILISCFIFSFIVSFIAEKRTLTVCLLANLILIAFMLTAGYLSNRQVVTREFWISETLELWWAWFGIPLFFALFWGGGMAFGRAKGPKGQGNNL